MHSSAPPRRSWGALALAIALFAAGYAVANRFQLTHGVLYRLAANDWPNAAGNFLVLAVQALALLAAIALLGRKLFVAAMALAFVSILVNLGYGQTRQRRDRPRHRGVDGAPRRGRWATSRASSPRPLLLAGLQTVLAIGLFCRVAFRLGAAAGSGRVGWRVQPGSSS